ncbi:MAG: type II toxin-antitoxin system RelE/ParE family toxin [Sphingomicrobium sp.]
MQIESIRHKALRRFAESGSPKGLQSGSVDRLRRMFAYIDAIETAEEFRTPPNFGAHQLTGDRKGEWSLTVTKNWRMIFRVNAAGAIEDMDLEDYH